MGSARTGGRWQVVGTEPAVAALLPELCGGDARAVLLTGPAGIGKTALADAVATAAEGAGPVLRIVASPGSTERPYGALGGLVALEPAIEDSPTGGIEAGGRLARVVRDRAGEDRLLLVVDDLPLLDATTAVEVAGLVRSGAISLLATARTGSRLPAAIDALVVEDRSVVHEVVPLDAALIGRAAAAALGADLVPSALHEVVRRSGGIPLYARELIRANQAAGRLRLGDAGWEADGDLVAPPTLFDLVASRFLHLDEATRRSIEALCLVQPLPVRAAGELLGIDRLADLEDGELVAIRPEGVQLTVRLAHPMHEESVLASSGPLRRHAAARRAVEALDHLASGDPDLALRLAVLRADHELPLPGVRAVPAAERALGLLDPATAERLLRASDEDDVEARVLLGAALAAQGRTDEADATLAAAWELATTDEHRARILSRRAGNLGAGAGRFDAAITLLVDGLRHVSEPRWRAFLETDLAYVRSWAGEAVDAASVASGHASAPTARANECLVGAILAAMSGELARADALVDEGLRLVHLIERDVPHARDMLVLSRFLSRAFGGEAAEARMIVDREVAAARAVTGGGTGVWLAVRSLHRLVDGDLAAAVTDSIEAVEELILGDAAGLRPLALAVRSVARARLGDLPGSRAAAAEITPAWRDEVKVQLHLTQAAGWQEVAEGRVDDGVALFAEAGHIGLASNHLPLGAFAAYDAVRLDRPRAVLDVLTTIGERWEGPMCRTMLAHAEALAATPRPRARDADRLVAVAERLPGLGLGLAATNAWLQAAAAAEAAGRDALVRRARLGAASCSFADLAAPAADRPLVLTRREEQVARAVADGRTSREVAEALGLSVRTIDNHLAAVYRKLDVSRRRDLADVLRRLSG